MIEQHQGCRLKGQILIMVDNRYMVAAEAACDFTGEANELAEDDRLLNDASHTHHILIANPFGGDADMARSRMVSAPMQSKRHALIFRWPTGIGETAGHE